LHEFLIKNLINFQKTNNIYLGGIDFMPKLQKMRLREGKVYRREELQEYSTSIDRELKELIDTGALKKVSPGLYYVPKKTIFGEAPPGRKVMIKAFLKDDDFLVMSPNNYNVLGLGTTQLYNKSVVYNHKRHGKFLLDGKTIEFKITGFPKNVTKEFLLVDLINNLDSLAEDANSVKEKIKTKLAEYNKIRLKRSVKSFGKVKTKKFFEEILK
jgi:hypothetical protein